MLQAYAGVVFSTASGLALAPNATIEVRRTDTGALASLFSDEAGTIAKANPFTAAADGSFIFFAAGLARGYSVKSTYNAEVATLPVQAVGTAAQYDYGAPISAKGDTVVGDNSTPTVAIRKAIGANGRVWRADSAQPDGIQWAVQKLHVCGRLTALTATPVPSADVTAATSMYFTPYNGDIIELYDGAGWLPYQFTELSQALSDTTKSPAAAVANANYDMFVWNDAGTMRCTRGPLWKKSATVTMTIATPCVVTWTAHGLLDGAPISFTTTGALPTGLTAGTTYFVKLVDANTFNLAATVGGANINTSGTQSGVHTATAGDHLARGTGAGTTELELFEGRYVNKSAITNGPAARAGHFVGTFRTTAAAQAEDSKAKRFVWNNYNRRERPLRNPVEATASWSYGTASWRQANANAANKFEFVRGLDEDTLLARLEAAVLSSGTGNSARVGIGIDTVTAYSDYAAHVSDCTNSLTLGASAFWEGLPGIGYHYAAWVENATQSVAITFYGNLTQAQNGLSGRMLA